LQCSPCPFSSVLYPRPRICTHPLRPHAPPFSTLPFYILFLFCRISSSLHIFCFLNPPPALFCLFVSQFIRLENRKARPFPSSRGAPASMGELIWLTGIFARSRTWEGNALS
jgi:hypothetical protein